MRTLILGGTAWLGRELATRALARGHDVTCLARGESGEIAGGARLVVTDRASADAYAPVVEQDWDAVIDVTWQPAFARSAVAALAGSTRHWVYVSSCSVYADHDTPGSDESAALLPALDSPSATRETYGEAKVACEHAVREAMGSNHSLLARAGLIGGPGDHSHRTTYWPARFAAPADPDGAVLVPDSPTLRTQLIDVRDLADWLVRCAEDATAGAFNVTGPALTLPEHLALARSVAGHTGPQVWVDQDWLKAQQVEPWAGPRSLPLWLPLPDYAGFGDRAIDAALRAGLTTRPLVETLADGLAWARSCPADPQPAAGLTDDQERELLAAAASR